METFDNCSRKSSKNYIPMKATLSFLGIILISTLTNSLSAQAEKHVIHLNAMMQVSAEYKASYKLVLNKNEEETFDGAIYDYMDKKIASGNYVKVGKNFLEDGHFVFYHPNGQLESEGEYVKGVKVGNWKRYDNLGKRKQDRYYPAESADLVRESMHLEKDDDNK